MSLPRSLVVSIHDVAPPHRARVQAMLDQLHALGVRRRSLLVVPNYHRRFPIESDPAFCGWLRELQAEGDEIVLHGYEHLGGTTPRSPMDRLKNRWLTQGEGEFLALDYDEAGRRLDRGLAVARRAELRTSGFVAPAWLINREGLRAARDHGFQYTNSYLRFVDLPNRRSRFAPSLVFGPGHLNEDVGVAAQSAFAGLVARSPIVRVVLHPPCVDHPARFSRILAVVERQVRDHVPVTYERLLEALRTEESNRPAGGAR